MVRLGYVLLLLLCTNSAWADSGAEKRAELAYKTILAGEVDEAISVYESLLQEGYMSADLLYNLGVAYHEDGQLGQAILQHEKALRLRPYDRTVEKNLQLLRDEQEDGLIPLPPFYLRAVWDKLAARMSPNAWSILAIILGWLAVAALVVWLMAQERKYKRWGFWTGMGLAVLTIVPIGLANSRKASLARSDQAILLVPDSAVLIAPGEDADVAMEIHEGVHLRILDSFEDWFKIELVDGRQGWLKQADVGVI